jgi:hypothetical protein
LVEVLFWAASDASIGAGHSGENAFSTPVAQSSHLRSDLRRAELTPEALIGQAPGRKFGKSWSGHAWIR